jgi:hypothetical protein
MEKDDYELRGPYGIGIAQLPVRCTCEGGSTEACPLHASHREYLKILEEEFPWVHWREPINLNDLKGHGGLACRICVARRGIRGDQIQFLPVSLEGHHKHLKEYHQIEGY